MALDQMALFDASGPLVAVRHFADRDLLHELARVDLDFGDGPIRIAVDINTDEVTLLEHLVEDEWVEIPASPVWEAALGCAPTWIWGLENNQGYRDGLQLEFKTSEGRLMLQLLGMASCLHLYRLMRLT